jgi:hypothetical protein
MFLGIATLAVAIVISVVAAYYSILGLTAIFAAAFWPIVIMGGALEAGKLMTAVWLHRNWGRATWTYKCYLVPALAFLMLLTSMGIFGFLSKAHLDQTVPTGDVAAQVALIDEKIKIERDNIANAQAVIKQMDAAVNGVIASGDQEVKLKDGSTKLNSAAERSLQIRRQQARDRAALTKQVEQAQANIVKLQEQKAPIAKDLRKIEAEVGPVKYVAALIYGDNPDTNTLEKAVRWVIILIVLVFDPLAIVLILAGSKQIEWAKGINFETEDHHREVMRKKEIEKEEGNELAQAPVANEDLSDLDRANELAQQIEPEIDVDLIIDQARSIQEIEQQQIAYEETIRQQTQHIEKLNSEIQEFETAIRTIDTELTSFIEIADQRKKENFEITERNSVLSVEIEKKNKEIEDLRQQQNDLHVQMEEALIAAEQAINELNQFKQKSQLTTMPKNLEEEFSLVADVNDVPLSGGEVSFGSGFPSDPNKGDLYLRVDYLPSKLFKWNGTKWIEVDKKSTDSYAYNEQYILHLVERIKSGEYDRDDLNDIERAQVDEYLKISGKNA